MKFVLVAAFALIFSYTSLGRASYDTRPTARSSRILYLDDCSSTTRPNGSTLNVNGGTSFAYDSNYNGLKIVMGAAGNPFYQWGVSFAFNQAITLEVVAECVTGPGGAPIFYLLNNTQGGIVMSGINMAIGTGAIFNHASTNQATTIISNAVGTVYVCRILYTRDKVVQASVTTIDGASYCNVNFTDTANYTAGDSAIPSLQFGAGNGSTWIIHRLAVYEGTWLAGVSQSP